MKMGVTCCAMCDEDGSCCIILQNVCVAKIDRRTYLERVIA